MWSLLFLPFIFYCLNTLIGWVTLKNLDLGQFHKLINNPFYSYSHFKYVHHKVNRYSQIIFIKYFPCFKKMFLGFVLFLMFKIGLSHQDLRNLCLLFITLNMFFWDLCNFPIKHHLKLYFHLSFLDP